LSPRSGRQGQTGAIVGPGREDGSTASSRRTVVYHIPDAQRSAKSCPYASPAVRLSGFSTTLAKSAVRSEPAESPYIDDARLVPLTGTQEQGMRPELHRCAKTVTSTVLDQDAFHGCRFFVSLIHGLSRWDRHERIAQTGSRWPRFKSESDSSKANSHPTSRYIAGSAATQRPGAQVRLRRPSPSQRLRGLPVRWRNKPGEDHACAYTVCNGLEFRRAGHLLKTHLGGDGSLYMYTLIRSEQTKLESRPPPGVPRIRAKESRAICRFRGCL
jgi:hypothetical protein